MQNTHGKSRCCSPAFLGMLLMLMVSSASPSHVGREGLTSRQSLLSTSLSKGLALPGLAATAAAELRTTVTNKARAAEDAEHSTSTIPRSLLSTSTVVGITVQTAAAVGRSTPPSLIYNISSTASNKANTTCSKSSEQLLTNEFFKPEDTGDMYNILLMAAMSHDIYPFVKLYQIPFINVAGGLKQQEMLHFQRQMSAKYKRLGARTIQFADYYQPKSLGAAGHAAVIGTAKGTSDLGQGLITGQFRTKPIVVFNKSLDMYFPVQQSMEGLYPKVLKAVKAAVLATDSASKARIYVTGHSLGGASACLGGLMLLDQGFNVGGVWSFSPFMAGTNCASSEDCWVTVYNRYLGDKTWMIWNNQDPIPILVESHFKTNNTLINPWGHVPKVQHWIRIVGDQCLVAGGTNLTQACPPEIDAADGSLDGKCPSIFHHHWPWQMLQHVARCALLQKPTAGNGHTRGKVMTGTRRLDACVRDNVWKLLLGLKPPKESVVGAEHQHLPR